MGCDVNYGRLSLCLLNRYYKTHNKTPIYQVWVDHDNIRSKHTKGEPYFSQNYTSLDEAVKKFIELKNKIDDPTVYTLKKE